MVEQLENLIVSLLKFYLFTKVAFFFFLETTYIFIYPKEIRAVVRLCSTVIRENLSVVMFNQDTNW